MMQVKDLYVLECNPVVRRGFSIAYNCEYVRLIGTFPDTHHQWSADALAPPEAMQFAFDELVKCASRFCKPIVKSIVRHRRREAANKV